MIYRFVTKASVEERITQVSDSHFSNDSLSDSLSFIKDSLENSLLFGNDSLQQFVCVCMSECRWQRKR